MNSLSWFLYAADALGGIKVLFVIFGAASTIAGVVGWIAWTVCKGGYADLVRWSHIDNERRESARLWIDVWKPLRTFLPGGFALGLVACLIPSGSTMYAIAASQVGEQVVKSETVQGIASDATRALQQWIKRQIDTDAKK